MIVTSWKSQRSIPVTRKYDKIMIQSLNKYARISMLSTSSQSTSRRNHLFQPLLKLLFEMAFRSHISNLNGDKPFPLESRFHLQKHLRGVWSQVGWWGWCRRKLPGLLLSPRHSHGGCLGPVSIPIGQCCAISVRKII